jgi:hypothetical protein
MKYYLSSIRVWRQRDAADKRRYIAARLAEIRSRSLYRFDFYCAGCMDPQITAPIYSDWECGQDCDYAGRVTP